MASDVSYPPAYSIVDRADLVADGVERHSATDANASVLGVVAIGRNEAARIASCLDSAIAQAPSVVYVDSASTDDSLAIARDRGVEIVELDMSKPFSAARARNAGFERLLAIAPDTEFVQFVDGDCQIDEHWLTVAANKLRDNPKLAVVCGRRRERFPEASVYNLLCDVEWDTPIGPAKASGGDALMRVEAVRAIGGYNPSVIAAEDDDLCVRLRGQGWLVERLDAEMTRHDAAMHNFGQWWKRAVRAGHGFAQGVALHGAPPERHFVKQLVSSFIWGALLPLVALALAWPTYGLSIAVLFALYLLQVARVTIRFRHLGFYPAIVYGINCVVAKFAAVVGAMKYYKSRLMGRSTQIIEYK